jgi:hypothetical protein
MEWSGKYDTSQIRGEKGKEYIFKDSNINWIL